MKTNNRCSVRRDVKIACQAVREHDFKMIATRTLDVSVEGVLLPMNMPMVTGEIANGSWTHLVGGGREIVATEVNGGYCPRDCFIRIRPGEARTGYLDYSIFGDREQIRALPSRELRFAPRVIACPR